MEIASDSLGLLDHTYSEGGTFEDQTTGRAGKSYKEKICVSG